MGGEFVRQVKLVVNQSVHIDAGESCVAEQRWKRGLTFSAFECGNLGSLEFPLESHTDDDLILRHQ